MYTLNRTRECHAQSKDERGLLSRALRSSTALMNNFFACVYIHANLSSEVDPQPSRVGSSANLRTPMEASKPEQKTTASPQAKPTGLDRFPSKLEQNPAGSNGYFKQN